LVGITYISYHYVRQLHFMKHILVFLLAAATAISCADDFTCSQAQEEIEAATSAYTAALDAGGDGSAECNALMTALEKLLAESSCPSDAKAITQSALNSLDCD
jgi:hypothetical protein